MKLPENKKITVARVSTISFFIASQLKKQLEDIEKAGFNLILISGEDKGMDIIRGLGIEHIPVHIPRKISLKKDLVALIQLYKIFKNRNIDIVHSTTPKAGLLCAIAAKLANIRIRLHTFTGQAWANKNGVIRWVAKFCDKLIIALNNKTYADSISQVEYLQEQNVIKSLDVISVLGSGSLAGVDLNRFNNKKSHLLCDDIKSKLGLNHASKVILYMGRVTQDKGICELLTAFNELQKKLDYDVYLVIVGPSEVSSDDKLNDLLIQAYDNPKIITRSFTSSPEDYFLICDFVCLPSYREGFGTVVIEAAAMGVPVLGTKVQGLKDSIIHNVTGYLVEPQDSFQLALSMKHLLDNPDTLSKLGINAYKRATEEFNSDEINGLVINEYVRLFNNVC